MAGPHSHISPFKYPFFIVCYFPTVPYRLVSLRYSLWQILPCLLKLPEKISTSLTKILWLNSPGLRSFVLARSLLSLTWRAQHTYCNIQVPSFAPATEFSWNGSSNWKNANFLEFRSRPAFFSNQHTTSGSPIPFPLLFGLCLAWSSSHPSKVLRSLSPLFPIIAKSPVDLPSTQRLVSSFPHNQKMSAHIAKVVASMTFFFALVLCQRAFPSSLSPSFLLRPYLPLHVFILSPRLFFFFVRLLRWELFRIHCHLLPSRSESTPIKPGEVLTVSGSHLFRYTTQNEGGRVNFKATRYVGSGAFFGYSQACGQPSKDQNVGFCSLSILPLLSFLASPHSSSSLTFSPFGSSSLTF